MNSVGQIREHVGKSSLLDEASVLYSNLTQWVIAKRKRIEKCHLPIVGHKILPNFYAILLVTCDCLTVWTGGKLPTRRNFPPLRRLTEEKTHEIAFHLRLTRSNTLYPKWKMTLNHTIFLSKRFLFSRWFFLLFAFALFHLLSFSFSLILSPFVCCYCSLSLCTLYCQPLSL